MGLVTGAGVGLGTGTGDGLRTGAGVGAGCVRRGCGGVGVARATFVVGFLCDGAAVALCVVGVFFVVTFGAGVTFFGTTCGFG